jgi:hypothetical protein
MTNTQTFSLTTDLSPLLLIAPGGVDCKIALKNNVLITFTRRLILA